MTDMHAAPDAPAFRDDEGHIDGPFLDAICEALENGDATRVKALAGDLHEADLGDLIEAIDEELRPRLVELLGDDFDFAALTELDETVRVALIEQLPTETVVEGVRELESDDAIYILEDLNEEDRAEILERLPPPERVALTRGLDFPEDSAGRLMQTDFIAVPPFWSVGQTIDYLRDTQELPDTFYEINVIDPAYKLIGTVPLDKLLRTKRPMRLDAILHETRHTVRSDQDQEEVARLFERYNLVSVPVVNDDERLVGILTVDDILDVIQEEADEDIRALGGVVGDEELSDRATYTARTRFPWLLINLMTTFISASIVALFDGSIEKMVALAVLMPIVASMGGNAGTQAMTITVRALATREMGQRSGRWMVWREVLIGLINGSLLAVVLGVVAAVWFYNAELGGVIAAALVVNMITAGLFGALIPLTLHRVKIDPAVASGVFLTTITDSVGFLAFLGFASWWFRLM